MLNYSYMILKLKECFSPGLQCYAFAFNIVNKYWEQYWEQRKDFNSSNYLASNKT